MSAVLALLGGPAPSGAEQRVQLAELRRAIGLSAMRVWLALLVRRNPWSCVSTCTDAGLCRVPFKSGTFEPLPMRCAGDPGVEFLTPNQVRYGRSRLRDFGLVSAAQRDDIEGSAKNGGVPGLPIEVYARQVLGERFDSRQATVPALTARRLPKAPGLGGARRRAGGARAGAGRKPLPPEQRKPRKSRAKLRLTPELERRISELNLFDDEQLRELERQLKQRDDRPALSLVPKTISAQPQQGEPAPTMATHSNKTKQPILTVVQPEARTTSPAADEIMVRPRGGVPLRPLLLVGAGLPPQPVDPPMVRVPPPPMLSASMTETQKRRLIARAWVGAAKSRGAPSKIQNVVWAGGHKVNGLLNKAAAALIDAEISPFVWCGWAIDMLRRASDNGDHPTAWVALAAATIMKHAAWCCEEDTASGRVVFPAATIELQRRWRECNDALRLVTSSEEARRTVKAILPRSKYVELLRRAKQQALMIQREFDAAATSGKWIW